jgi:class 3 adenylate cyclase
VNFIGDAVLAVFNTPVRIDFPADAALECYKNCRYELAASRESRLKVGSLCLHVYH